MDDKELFDTLIALVGGTASIGATLGFMDEIIYEEKPDIKRLIWHYENIKDNQVKMTKSIDDYRGILREKGSSDNGAES